jgi:hypothetical protein
VALLSASGGDIFKQINGAQECVAVGFWAHWIAASFPETITLIRDEGYDKRQNGKLLLARGPRACGPDAL